MPRRTANSAVVDGVLKLIALGGLTATVLIAPNAMQALDKPLEKLFKKLDHRTRQRELRKTLSYIKTQGLVTEDYKHGLQLTDKAKCRLAKLQADEMSIARPKVWDKKWRIIFFDIPESQKSNRDAFAGKVRQMDFKVLQRSVFVHPFPCRHEVESVANYYGVSDYISYVEADHIDNQKAIIKRFNNLLRP